MKALSKLTDMEVVGRDARDLGGRMLHATVYRESDRSERLRDIVISDGCNAYRVVDVDSDVDIPALLSAWPQPNDATDKSIVHLASDGHGAEIAYFIRPLHVNMDYPETRVGCMYPLAEYGSVPGLDLPMAPRLFAVALEETRNWSADVISALGRMKAVYVYNEAMAFHLCEVTPSYELSFIANECEAVLESAEEEDEIAASLGYSDWFSLRTDNGGEFETYVHCHSIDKAVGKVEITMPEQWTDEFMFTADQAERDRMLKDAISEIGTESNGPLIDDPFPEGRTFERPMVPAGP